MGGSIYGFGAEFDEFSILISPIVELIQVA